MQGEGWGVVHNHCIGIVNVYEEEEEEEEEIR
jgi:hypothetical protein